MKQRRPQPGEYVTVLWLDSGADHCCGPSAAASLRVSEAVGRVVRCGPCATLRPQLTRGMSAEVLVLAHCSAGADDDSSHLGSIWWPSVVKWRVIE